jgi:uncharacterized protein (TIGR02147 family)
MKIFNFSDYRMFVNSYIQSLPKRGHGEISRLAKSIQVSATLVSQVLHGEKQFSVDQGFDLSKYLGLDHIETDYLICLIEMDRAGSQRLKDYWSEKCRRLKSQSEDTNEKIKKDRTLTEEEKTVYYTHYLFTSIRLFCSIGQKRIHDIQERFSLSREKTLEYLDLLIKLNLLKKTGDLYENTDQVIFLDKTSPHIYRHHMNWRIQAMKQIERPKPDDLSFSYPMTISKKDFVVLRKKWVAEVLEIQKTLQKTEPETIAFLNLDFFELD